MTINWINVLDTFIDGASAALGWMTTTALFVFLIKIFIFDKSDTGNGKLACFICNQKLDEKQDMICTVNVNGQKVKMCEKCGGKIFSYSKNITETDKQGDE